MAENETNQEDQTTANEDPKKYRGPWGHIIRGMWRSPLGLFGVVLTTVSITLMILGVIVEVLGIVQPVCRYYNLYDTAGRYDYGAFNHPISRLVKKKAVS